MTEKILREKRLKYMRERNGVLKDVYSNIFESEAVEAWNRRADNDTNTL